MHKPWSCTRCTQCVQCLSHLELRIRRRCFWPGRNKTCFISVTWEQILQLYKHIHACSFVFSTALFDLIILLNMLWRNTELQSAESKKTEILHAREVQVVPIDRMWPLGDHFIAGNLSLCIWDQGSELKFWEWPGVGSCENLWFFAFITQDVSLYSTVLHTWYWIYFLKMST